MNDILLTEIKATTLDSGTKNRLFNARIKTVGDLIEWTEADLMALRGFGIVKLLDIKSYLRQQGLSLKPSPLSNADITYENGKKVVNGVIDLIHLPYYKSVSQLTDDDRRLIAQYVDTIPNPRHHEVFCKRVGIGIMPMTIPAIAKIYWVDNSRIQNWFDKAYKYLLKFNPELRQALRK